MTAPAVVVDIGPARMILDRLDIVRTSGRGWTAKCPAHDDGTASLSIAIGDDGRLLVHCFAGCHVTSVVAALGLSVGDLFARRITHVTTSAERTALREIARQSELRAALSVLDLEARIVEIAAHDRRGSAALCADDLVRLRTACDRIHDARIILCKQCTFRPVIV